MDTYVKEIYPRVFKNHQRQTVFVALEEGIDADLLRIKIQPMEKYAIPHTSLYRGDEEARYEYRSLQKASEGVYAVEYDFAEEQKYSVKFKYDDELVHTTYLYSLAPDLCELKAFKGDLHMHTENSDGMGTPFEVACAYRAAGFDFIAITDHHKFAPSLVAQAEVKELTDAFVAFRGEEVHNKSHGLFHIVNFNGESSVNEIIETDGEYVSAEIKRILETYDLSSVSDPGSVAYRIFIVEQIRKVNGVAIMSHPFWEAAGEYHIQVEEFIYHWQHGNFDALEVIADCDRVGNGNNLQETLRCDMMADGYRIPVVGASDSHRAVMGTGWFNRHFTIVFAKDAGEIPDAIKAERSVAVRRRDDTDFYGVGRYRYVKYARFLLREYYPQYAKLCHLHAEAMSKKDKEQIREAEKQIAAFQDRFFAV